METDGWIWKACLWIICLALFKLYDKGKTAQLALVQRNWEYDEAAQTMKRRQIPIEPSKRYTNRELVILLMCIAVINICLYLGDFSCEIGQAFNICVIIFALLPVTEYLYFCAFC